MALMSQKICIFAVEHIMCSYILLKERRCALILVCTKLEKLPNNAIRKVVIVSTYI